MSDDTEQPKSVDARQSAKAYPGQQVVERLRKLADAIEPDEAKAAVQQRSGDGLLPCPFCDVANDINQKTLGTIPLMSTFMECGECGCRGPLAGSRNEAVALWNTRASGNRQ